MSKPIPTLLVLVMAAHVVLAGMFDNLQTYSTPDDKAPYGNYYFKYPAELFVKEDYIYTNPVGIKGPHTVVLERASDRNIPPGTPDRNRIEINVIRTDCTDYKHCREIKGISIGTNSDDPGFLQMLDLVLSCFKKID